MGNVNRHIPLPASPNSEGEKSKAGLRKVYRGAWIPLAGTALLAALIPLIWQPSLIGAGVIPYLCSFCAASLAYLAALTRLPREQPKLGMIWAFAVGFRLVMLLTPVTLSEDVYRYIWDGDLVGQGINPYAHPVNSPLLNAYDTPLRERVNFPWMATPYLPAAQGYFALVEALAPQSPFAFQLGAALLDLASGWLVVLSLRRLAIPEKAVLVYLWNPLVVVEFAHGAHVDALMVFCVSAGLWGLVQGRKNGLTISALALAASVLVKGMPLLAAPVFLRRWGTARVFLFGIVVALPLIIFAAGAGWGLGSEADGRGLFGALRIYAASWKFNSGLYLILEKLFSQGAARIISAAMPAGIGLLLGWAAWRGSPSLKPGKSSDILNNADTRRLLRWAALPLWAYLVCTPTVHPWYLTLVVALLPYFWQAPGEDAAVRRWIYPWVYFMVFEAFTYLSYSGLSAPDTLEWIQLAGYLPFWALLIWAGFRKGWRALDLNLTGKPVV